MTARFDTRVAIATAGLAIAALAACDETTNTNPTGSGGGAGATGGAGGGGAIGGAGGDGGVADGGAGGGGGMAPAGCLAESEHDTMFTIDLAGLCVVDKFTAPFEIGYALQPRWGRHGGPVTLVQAYDGASPTDEITITRWAVPTTTNASLTTLENLGPFSLGIGAVALGPFISPVVIDLPLSSWTVVGWTGENATGEIIALDGTTVGDRWANVGYFDAATLDDGTKARLVHTGQSEILDGDFNNAETGVYAADFCSGPTLCASDPAFTIATWGAANGPVARDTAGNVFVVNSDFIAGDQELRAFHQSEMAPGENGESATVLFTVAGYGSALAVIDAAPGMDGIVLYQPIEGVDAQPVIAQHFKVTGNAVVAEGTPTAAIALLAGDGVSLMNDAEGRVWLGIATGGGETTFFVLDRDAS